MCHESEPMPVGNRPATEYDLVRVSRADPNGKPNPSKQLTSPEVTNPIGVLFAAPVPIPENPDRPRKTGDGNCREGRQPAAAKRTPQTGIRQA